MYTGTCKNCNKEFTYKWHGRGNVCSLECSAIYISKCVRKYTDEQIANVIALKKAGKLNSQIVQESGVNINKVKEIVKENGLFVPKDEVQSRAYKAKLAKNPDAMKNMRSAYGKLVRSDNSLEKIKAILLSRGYEYVRGFECKSKPFYVRCLKCKNVREAHKINTVVKNSCNYCFGSLKVSAAEIEIKEWFESLGLKVERYKFKERLGGMEIDVYLPDLKVGIEYCGLYWHSEGPSNLKPAIRHVNKLIKANKDGIRLITIFQDEWRDRKDQIKGFLLSVVGKNTRKIFARKTDLKPLSKEEIKQFMDDNHIQGFARSNVAFGLFLGEELLAAISGSMHHRPGQETAYVLNRLVFKKDVSVAGGSSKLLKSLVNYSKSEGFKSLISWSDNRWSEGNVYQKLGFILDCNLKPDYSYVDGQSRISKQSCQKKTLAAKGAKGDTESEMASSLGYKKIWDCGKIRWIKPLI